MNIWHRFVTDRDHMYSNYDNQNMLIPIVLGCICMLLSITLVGIITHSPLTALGLFPIVIPLLIGIGNWVASAAAYLVTEGEKEVPWGYFSQHLLPEGLRAQYLECTDYEKYCPLSWLVAFLGILTLPVSLVLAVAVYFPMFLLMLVIFWGIMYGVVLIARKVYKLSQRFKKHESDPNAHNKGDENV